MASQRDTYGRFLFWGVGKGVDFVFSSVEFQSSQHLGHSLKKKKKKEEEEEDRFKNLNDSACRGFLADIWKFKQRHPKGKSRYSSNSRHLTFILIFKSEMAHRFLRCKCQKGSWPRLLFQRWANLYFPRSSSRFAGPITQADFSGKRKMEISYVEGTWAPTG